MRSTLFTILMLCCYWGSFAQTAPISGSPLVCVGATTSLFNDSTGGVWSSGDLTVASVDAATGVVSGVAAGTASISYTISSGLEVVTVTVGVPATISGSPIICPPTIRTYSATEAGGTWSSGDAHISVNPSTGTVFSFGTGPATITYTTTSGCVSTLTVSVDHPVISGGSGIICVGSTTTFSGSPAGGRWTSGYITHIPVDSITGVVSGLSYAPDIPIRYTMYPGCSSSTTVTVNPPPPARIYGNAYLCTGQEVTLSNASAGGTWSSSNTGICTVSSTGIVTGVAQGYASVSYTTSSTCGPSSALKNIYVGQPMKWDWATTAGSNQDDLAGTYFANGDQLQSSIVTDGAGNSYVAGTFRDVAAFGTYTVSAGLAIQGYVAKYNSTGNCVWVKQLGLSGSNDITYFNSISRDAAGNLYVSGLNKWFSGTTDSFGSGVLNGGTVEKMFFVKYDGNGNEVWAQQAVSGFALPGPLVADASGNVYVAGENHTAMDFGSGVSVSGANYNYLVKYNTAGVPQWVSEYVTSTGYTGIIAMDIDQAGNCIITGGMSAVTPTIFNTVPSTTTLSVIGNGDVFVGMINPSGQLKWVSSFGGPVPSYYPYASWTWPEGIVADDFGYIYVTGISTADITIGTTPITVATRSGVNSYLAKYDTSGHPVWAKQATVSVVGDNFAQSLCLNGNQEPVIAGVYFGDMSFDTVNFEPISTDYVVRQDLFVAQFDTAGGCKWGINATTTGTQPQCKGLGMDTSGNFYLTGSIAGTSEFGCNNTTAFGGYDVFLAKIIPASCTPITLSPLTAICAGTTTTVSSSGTGGVWSSSAPSVATIDAASGVITGVGAGTATISYVVSGCASSAATTTIIVNQTPTLTLGAMPVVCPGDTSAAIPYSGATGGSLTYTLAWDSSASAAGFAGVQEVITTVAGNNSLGSTYSGDGGPATAAGVPLPTAVATDAAGNIYIATEFNTVRKVDVFGNISTFAGDSSTVGTYSGDGGPATAAGLNLPTALAVDALGNVYIADVLNRVIRKVDHSGIITTVAGNGSLGSSGDGGPATAAMLGEPMGVAVDASGNIYIADNNGGAIRKVNTSGIISRFAGNGSFGYSGDGGPATAASINPPQSIAIDASGNLYLGDFSRYLVRKVDTSGIISTVAGTGSYGYSGDGGPATAAQLSHPYGLATDAMGNFYIAEPHNNVVRKINPSGIISTVASSFSLSWGYSGDGGPATAARMYLPNSVATDVLGNIYIADMRNNVIRKVSSPVTLPSSPVVVGVPSTATTGTYAGTITLYNGTCRNDYPISVTIAPMSISGPLLVCSGSASTLSGSVPGGAWSSSHVGVATVGSGSGIIYGVAAGTASITYSTGLCTAVATVTVSPTTISGISSVCSGSVVTLSASPSGGTWASSSAGVATISSTGVVSGVSDGTSIISYTTASGCTDTLLFAVGGPAITGASSVCNGLTTTLNASVSGGTWSGGSYIANVNPSSGVVTGSYPGTTSITYSVPGGCSAITTFTVSASPSYISGDAGLCTGGVSYYSSYPFGGSWTSSAPSVATISSTGSLTAVSAGTSVISYTLSSGCAISQTLTVNDAPDTITGTANICIGTTSTLSNSVTGGIWSSSDLAIATVGSGTGIIGGVSAGMATITYSVNAGCFATITTTVGPEAPAAITGITNLCSGQSVSLSSATAGGTWSSTSPGVATISSAGYLSAIGSGSTLVLYTTSTTCGPVSTSVMVNVDQRNNWEWATTGGSTGNDWAGMPNYNSSTITTDSAGNSYITGTINGTATFGSISVSSPSGGPAVFVAKYNAAGSCLWAKSFGGDATSDPYGNEGTSVDLDRNGNCYVTGTFKGSASSTITFGSSSLTGTGLREIFVAKYDASGNELWVRQPSAAGSSNNYAKSIKTDAITGGSYITGYLGSAGVAFGSLAAGTAPGAYAVKYDATGTALWSVAIGAGNADGLCITDDPSGNSFVSGYMQSTETFATTSGTVSLTAIGTRDVFVAKVNASGGLAWVRQFGGTSSSFYSKYAYAKGIATDPSGNIYLTGDFTQIINFGSTVLTHPAATGTASFVAKLDASGSPLWAAQSAPGANDVSARSIKVNSAGEAFIAGVYTGSVTLGAVALPTYSSYSNAFVAKYNASGNCVWGQQALPSGGAPDLRGISMDYTGNIYVAGNVQYPTDFGCHTTTAYGGYDALIAKLGPSCNALAAVGGTSVCAGSTTTLSDATSGGHWSMIGANATVDATTGEVTGITPGTAAITYTTPSGCRRTTSVTVLAQPAAITGLASLCAGSTITLSTTATGGTWSSSTTSVATVSSARIVTGVTNGTSVISYTLSSGCSRTHTVTVTSLPAITGAMAICVGQSATLGNALAGGTWASSHPAIVGVGSASGIATAVSYSATVPTVTYTASGCRVTASVPVNALPNTINGINNVCEGAVITLSTTTTGGTWSSSATSVATVGTNGRVYGAVAGTASISYTVSSGCARAITVSVNAMPSAIINAGVICLGSTRTLSNAVSGGVWTSSHPTIANIGSTGVATGISSSSISPTISYTMPGACRATATVTVYALPAGINGPLSVCEGAVVTLSTTTTGGAWSSGTISVATVGSVVSGNRGEVSGILAGTSVISYTSASGCARLVTVTVNPSAGSITGQSIMCPGQSVTFTTTATGGTWTSSNPTIASVHSSTGVVTGSTSLFGFPTITYTMPGGCRSTFPTRVASPSAISGPTAVCGGRTITLGNTVTGGSWTSSDASIATVGSTGVVLGGSAGVAVITYELGSGCFRTTTITVNAGPSAINGPGSVCFGSTMTLTNATPGGTWTSSHFTTASIGSATGIVTGLAASATIPTITYSLGSGCFALRSVSVVFIATIAGPSSVCQGRTITLGNTAPGGTWSSSNGAVASISAAGILAGLAPGTTVISYTIGGGSCAVSRTVTVNPYADITGPGEVCNGSSITLSNTLTGGTWASYYVGIATIGSVSGIITTVAPSSVPTTITYTMPGGCTDTALVYVRYLAPITGPTGVCEGTIANLSNIYTGGTWSSSDASVATIGSSTASVYGVTAGVVTLTYNMPSGCFATYTQTVHPAAPAISGPNRVCLGTDITLSNAVSGGTWSVYYPTATIGSTSGIVSGITAGSVHNIITYTLPTGCRDTALVEVSSCLRGIAGNDGAEEAGFLLVPNPSRGEFMVKGTFGHNQDQAITIEVTNMLGQVVHQVVAEAPGGQLAINVRLDNEPANGMYLVTISAGTDKKVFHVVINR